MARLRHKTTSIMTPVLEAIEHYLSDHEDKYFLEQTQRLVRENNNLRRKKNLEPLNGFVFEGVGYRLPEPITQETALRGIEMELELEMESLLASRKDRLFQLRQISMILLLICKDHVQTLQDLRDLLPDCLIPAFPDLGKLDRERPVAFSIEGNPSMQSRWEKALASIEYFTATRMLY